MKQFVLSLSALFILVFSFSHTARAQFNHDSSQTFFVCNAANSQISVNAFGDNNGGTYSFWIDKRNGAAGTAIYGQHLDSLGVPLWAPNGKLFYQENGKEVWLMKAVRWQSGILMSWVQGGFGIGGDTLFCNYYNQNGVSQWAQPVVVGNKQGNIIYVNIDDLNIFPNDSGATITFGLTPSGGNNYFSFNRIDFSGNLHWPLDNFTYYGNGYYYHAASDNHNGFYVATSTGGLGADIFMGHFDLQGNLTIPSPVNISTVVGGRGNSEWKIVCDTDSNAYVVWASYTNQNISINKVTPNGTLPWGTAKSICAETGSQELPDVIINSDTIYSIWDDGRPGASNYYIYMQKMDTSGTAYWTNNGIQIYNSTSYIPYPKLVFAGNKLITAYQVSGGYRAQEVRTDSTTVWYQNGIFVNTLNAPFYGDHVLVAAADGSVTSIWRDNGDNICAARIRPNGTLTSIAEQNQNTEFNLFPNPANDQFQIQFGKSLSDKVMVTIYNMMGQVVYKNEYTPNNHSITISTAGISNGYYTVNVSNDLLNFSRKLSVVK